MRYLYVIYLSFLVSQQIKANVHFRSFFLRFSNQKLELFDNAISKEYSQDKCKIVFVSLDNNEQDYK